MEELYNWWTRRRIEKAMDLVLKIIPRQDRERIISNLDKFFPLAHVPDEPDLPEGCLAQTAILKNDKYAIAFFLPRLWHESKEDILLVVAHEFAHVFLEHCRDLERSHEQHEEEVHQQLETWGIEEG